MLRKNLRAISGTYLTGGVRKVEASANSSDDDGSLSLRHILSVTVTRQTRSEKEIYCEARTHRLTPDGSACDILRQALSWLNAMGCDHRRR